MDPAVVFHPHSYKGESAWLIEQFTSGNYIGLSLLQWMGLCFDEERAAEEGVKPFPHMI
jgi:hypothetical protein